MKNGLKAKVTTVKDLQMKGWRVQRRIITGVIYEKGNQRVFYDPKKREILHKFTV